MLHRQDSLLSSSHRQTPPPENHHAKPIGCMSGFFKLFSKYQNRNKLLTFGRKHVKSPVSTSTKSKALVQGEQKQDSSSATKEDSKNLDKNGQNFETNILSSSDITPRSPMLPQEIWRPNALTKTDNTTTPPAPLVARLMGLGENHQLPRQSPVVSGNVRMEEENSSSSTEEKRRKLLQALAKCNQDLESLKKIIMAVQSVDQKSLNSPPRVLKDDSLAKTCLERKVEQRVMRPVSVLEEFSRYSRATKSNSNGTMPRQSKQMPVKKLGEDDSICFFNKVHTATLKHRVTTPTFWSSKAMIQSVNEVCNDIIWGEKRELGNLGLVLQNYICRDLIEEVVLDLGFCKKHKLPFEACKRRLSF